MQFIKITEQESVYRNIDKMKVAEILACINQEDNTVATAIGKALENIEKLVEAVAEKMLSGGRLIYIGSGTSGRLAVIDAAECPPTFGVSPDLVAAVIAGGEKAFTQAVEDAEDDISRGWGGLMEKNVTEKDVVVGVSASGTTPYVLAALAECKKQNITTGCIVCNPNSPIGIAADYPVEVVVGPEFITGSTRMKSGSAQKMVLNMISTSVMVLLGRIEDNKMVNMQLTNQKLVDRAVKMVMEKTGMDDYGLAKELLLKHGSVQEAGLSFSNRNV